MPSKISKRRNVVAIAVNVLDKENGQIKVDPPPPADRNRGSSSIQKAREILENILLDNDLEESEFLLGRTVEGLSEVIIELNSIEGNQRLFELWVNDPI